MMALVLLLLGAAELDGVDVLFPDSPQPARLRVSVTVDGHSPAVAWADFLDKLFTHFDRDGDNALSLAEAARVFPLPLPDEKEAKLDFQRLDSDKDGRGSRAEFLAFYRSAGFLPVVAVIRPPSAAHRQLSETLFRQLDRDNDGKLTLVEWQKAPDLLHRFDENEDEILDSTELLTLEMNAAPVLAKTLLRSEPAAGTPDGLVRFAIGTPDSPVRIEAKSPRFQAASESRSLLLPGGHVTVSDIGSAHVNRFRQAKDFYLAQFADAMGDKTSIGKSDLEADTGLQAIAEMFDIADRNGDGKLTSTELISFLELVERGVDCQVLVSVDDRGPSLFDLFDINADGRLDLGELNRAAKLPPIEKSALPTQFRLTASRGTTGREFGPVTVPLSATQAPVKPARKAIGPRWFQAMDHNGDGFLSATEFLGTPARFTALDRNGDRQISAEEAEIAERK